MTAQHLPIQSPSYLPCKIAELVWLLQIVRARVDHTVMHGITGIASCVEHFKVRVEGNGLIGELTARHAGHDNVGKQQLDLWMSLQDDMRPGVTCAD